MARQVEESQGEDLIFTLWLAFFPLYHRRRFSPDLSSPLAESFDLLDVWNFNGVMEARPDMHFGEEPRELLGKHSSNFANGGRL